MKLRHVLHTSFFDILFQTMHERHNNYYDIEASSHFEMGLMIGENLKQVTLNWLKGRLADPQFGTKVDRAAAYLELTKTYFPQFVQELLGQSQSLGLTLQEMWAVSLEEELDFLDAPSDNCTTVLTNNGLLLGHTEDQEVGTAESIVLLRKKLGKLTTLEIYFLGTLGGTSVTINSHRYLATRNVLADFDTTFGIPRGTIARFLSETNDPRRDLLKTASMPRRMGASLIFTSDKGEVTTAETTSRTVVPVDPQIPFVHTNHYLVPELQPFDCNQNSNSTYERYETATAKVRPIMTTTELLELMGDNSRGPQQSIFNERTIARAVINWAEYAAWFWLQREEEKGWIKYNLDFMSD